MAKTKTRRPYKTYPIEEKRGQRALISNIRRSLYKV